MALQRLKSRKQFQAVLAGERVTTTAHFSLHRCPLDCAANGSGTARAAPDLDAALFNSADLWLGAMVPKRWCKRAVTRNAIKRQIYIVSKEFVPALPLAAYVVRLRRGFDRANFVSANSIMLRSAVRLELVQLLSSAAPMRARTSTGLS